MDEQEDPLGVDEEGPAREAEQQQDEDAPLQDGAHLLQVLAAICLGEERGSGWASQGARGAGKMLRATTRQLNAFPMPCRCKYQAGWV